MQAVARVVVRKNIWGKPAPVPLPVPVGKPSARQLARQAVHDAACAESSKYPPPRDQQQSRFVMPSKSRLYEIETGKAKKIVDGIKISDDERARFRAMEIKDIEKSNRRPVTPATMARRLEKEDEVTVTNHQNIFGDLREIRSRLDIYKDYRISRAIEAEAVGCGLVGRSWTITTGNRATANNLPDDISEAMAGKFNDVMTIAGKHGCKPVWYIRRVAPQADRTPHYDVLCWFEWAAQADEFERLLGGCGQVWRGVYTDKTVDYIFKIHDESQAIKERAWRWVWKIRSFSSTRTGDLQINSQQIEYIYKKNNTEEASLWRRGGDLAYGRADILLKKQGWYPACDLTAYIPKETVRTATEATARGLSVKGIEKIENKLTAPPRGSLAVMKKRAGVINYSEIVNNNNCNHIKMPVAAITPPLPPPRMLQTEYRFIKKRWKWVPVVESEAPFRH